MKTKTLVCGMSAILFLHSCNHHQKETEQETLRVNIEEVRMNKMALERPYIGVAEEEQSTMVSFTNMGILKKITTNMGEHVKKGTLLATIDDTQARNALAAAASALEQAKDAQERMRKLYENTSLPEMKWIEVESKVKQAQATYDMCKKNLEDCAIYAPCDGVIGNKVMNTGETVLPSIPVMDILSIDKIKIRVNIPEKEIAAVKDNTQSRIIIDAIPGITFTGMGIEKGVSADAITHTYDIMILLDNPQHLVLPGMVAKVFLSTGDDNTTITLPIKAVQQGNNQRLFVWIVENGKAQRRHITTGQCTGNRIVIESGLQEGEKVIIEGYQKVGEGTPVIF